MSTEIQSRQQGASLFDGGRQNLSDNGDALPASGLEPVLPTGPYSFSTMSMQKTAPMIKIRMGLSGGTESEILTI